MQFAKSYKCSKCGHTFPVLMSGNFVTGVTPSCPVCRSGESKSITKVVKEKKK